MALGTCWPPTHPLRQSHWWDWALLFRLTRDTSKRSTQNLTGFSGLCHSGNWGLTQLGFNPLAVLQGKAGPSPQPHLFFLVMMRTSLNRKRWQRRPVPRRKIPASSESSRCSSPRFSSHRDAETSGKGWNSARNRLSYCPPHQQHAKPRQELNLQRPWGQLGRTHHMRLSVFPKGFSRRQAEGGTAVHPTPAHPEMQPLDPNSPCTPTVGDNIMALPHPLETVCIQQPRLPRRIPSTGLSCLNRPQKASHHHFHKTSPSSSQIPAVSARCTSALSSP